MMLQLTKPERDAQFVLSILAILGNILVMVGVSVKTNTTKTYFSYLRCLLVVDSGYFLGMIIQWSFKNKLPNLCHFISWAQEAPVAAAVWLMVVMIVDKIYQTDKKHGSNALILARAMSVSVLVIVVIITLVTPCSLPQVAEINSSKTMQARSIKSTAHKAYDNVNDKLRICSALLTLKKFLYRLETKYTVRQTIIQPRHSTEEKEILNNMIMYQKYKHCSNKTKTTTKSDRPPTFQMSKAREYFWKTLYEAVINIDVEPSLRGCWTDHTQISQNKNFVCRLNEPKWRYDDSFYTGWGSDAFQAFKFFVELVLHQNYSFNVIFWEYEYSNYHVFICDDCLFEILRETLFAFPVEGIESIRESLQTLRSELRNVPLEGLATFQTEYQSEYQTEYQTEFTPPATTPVKSAEVMNNESRSSSLIQGIANGIIPSLLIIILVVVDTLKTNHQTSNNKKCVKVQEQGTDRTEPSSHRNTEDGPTMIPLHRLNNSQPPNTGASTSLTPLPPSAPTVEHETIFEPDDRYASFPFKTSQTLDNSVEAPPVRVFEPNPEYVSYPCLPFKTSQKLENSVEAPPVRVFEPNPEYVSYPIITTGNLQPVNSCKSTITPNFDPPPRYCDIESIGIFSIEGSRKQTNNYPQPSINQSTETPDRHLNINSNDSEELTRTHSYRKMIRNHISTTVNEGQTVAPSNPSAIKFPMWNAIRNMSVLRGLVLLIKSSVELAIFWNLLESETEFAIHRVSLWSFHLVLFMTCAIFLTFSKSFCLNLKDRISKVFRKG